MESAKNAVKDFVKNHGKKDTTVQEEVNPAVVHETVKPTRHEDVTTVVDKEVHQDHYHTTVQPVRDTETLPEKHAHNVVPVEHRQYDRDDRDATKRSVDREAAAFKDEQTILPTTKTASAAPVVGSEHKHHHVHETIQPVIQKETIQPEVVHTTVPIHEVHQNASQHHAASALPPISMSEFKAKGGALEGRGERTDQFEGEPRIASGAGFGDGSYGDSSGLRDSTTSGHHGTSGMATSTHHTGNTGSGVTGSSGYGSTTGNSAYGSTTGSSTKTKPSTMDKLDPRKDADGDGKKGMMD